MTVRRVQRGTSGRILFLGLGVVDECSPRDFTELFVHVGFVGFIFFSRRNTIIHKRFKKKQKAPIITAVDFNGQLPPTARGGSAVCLSFGRVSALKPHHQTSLLGPSLSGTSGWPRASFLHS